MLCKDKITSIFCIIDDILKEINHSEDIPPAVASLQLVPNSKFIIPLALFRALYRLKKRLSLWCIKKNSRAILLYCID